MENENQTKQSSGLPSRPLIGSIAPCDTSQFLSLPVGSEFLWLNQLFTKINETEARFEATGEIWNTFGGTK